MEILAARNFFPGFLLSPVKEILHTNASIKLEENAVQSFFNCSGELMGGRNIKANIF